MSEGIESRIAGVFAEVSAACERAGRDPDDVTIVAVSKSVERGAIDAALRCGVRHFGENRVQDAVAKFATPLGDGATLHMIGQLQTNKAGAAARLFDVVESVDRSSLVTELEKQAAKLDRPLSVFLQVNIAGEAQKAGCAPSDAPELVRAIIAAPHLDLVGLMTIAPLVADPEEVRPVFRALRELKDRLSGMYPEQPLTVLSMGMSNDFRVAIEEGATNIRVGRAIFG